MGEGLSSLLDSKYEWNEVTYVYPYYRNMTLLEKACTLPGIEDDTFLNIEKVRDQIL